MPPSRWQPISLHTRLRPIHRGIKTAGSQHPRLPISSSWPPDCFLYVAAFRPSPHGWSDSVGNCFIIMSTFRNLPCQNRTAFTKRRQGLVRHFRQHVGILVKGHLGDTSYFTTLTFTARRPLGPLSTLNSTLVPSSKASKSIPSKAERWKKISLPSSALMNPNLLSQMTVFIVPFKPITFFLNKSSLYCAIGLSPSVHKFEDELI